MVDEITMSTCTWHKAFILDNLQTLKKSIEPSANLYANLVQKGVMTTNHIQRFELPKPADTKKMDFVLFFQHRPAEHWHSFMDALYETNDVAYDTVYTLWKNYDPTQGVQGKKYLEDLARKEEKSPAVAEKRTTTTTNPTTPQRPPPIREPSPPPTYEEALRCQVVSSPVVHDYTAVYTDFRLRPRRANENGVKFYNNLYQLRRCLRVSDILSDLISEDIVDVDDNERWCNMFRPNATQDFFLKMKMYVESGKYDEGYLLNTIAHSLRKSGNAHLVKYL